MKIDFILSDTTKSATTLALKNIAKNSKKDLLKNHIAIVPETKSIIIEKELLNLVDSGAFANVFIYSFVRLLDRLGAVSSDKILSKQVLVILIRKIINDNISKLSCYKKTAKSVGFAEKIYDTIAQFKSSGISVEDLKESLKTNSDSLREKLKDIIFLYEEYEKYLSGNLYDDCDKLALISGLTKGSEFIKNSDVYIVGFDNITFEMQTVLRNIAMNARSITFSCVYYNSKKLNKHIQTNELFVKFKNIADSLNYPYIPRYFESQKQGDFKFIKNHLFSVENRKFTPAGNIQIFKAKSEKFEIDFVANTILREIKNGKRYRDIGVLVNGLEDKLELIKDCFEAYKIPYFANVDQKIDNHFMVKFIVSAFEIYSSNLRFENVLTFVSNPLFDAENFDIFERYVYEMGINYDEFLKPVNPKFIENYIGKNYSDFEDSDTEYVNSNNINNIDNDDLIYSIKKREIDMLKTILQKLSDFYYKLRNILKFAESSMDYLRAIDTIIEFFDIPEKLEKISQVQRSNELEIESEITSAIFSKLQTFNSQIKNFLGESIMTIPEFLLVYKSGFSSYKINLSPVSIDCVIVQGNTDGFYNIKDLFIVGAVEGNFPAKIQDSGIILDSELDEAKLYIGKTIEPAVKDINRREKFKAFETLVEPSEKLFISYSEKSQDGKICSPAQIITNLCNMFGDEIEKTSYETLDFINFDIMENIFLSKVNKFLNDENISAVELNKCRNILGEKISKEVKSYLDNLSYGNKDFTVKGVDELYFYNDKTSISQLQTYFDCPYKFFAEYGLKLKENKVALMLSPDIGTIIHRVAELFLKDIANFEKLDELEFDKQLSKLVDLSMEENNFSLQKNKSLFSLIMDECLRLCKFIISEQKNSSFKFYEAEYQFDGKNAISLNLDGDRRIFIHGKIDRIDKFGDYVRVIDYKTGSIESKLDDIYYGKKIQLAIYLLAIQGKENLKPAGIFYFPIHSDFQKNEKDSQNCYRMIGLILDDIDVVKNMDNELSPENRRSKYVPITIKCNKNTGEISFYDRLKRYSIVEFENIKEYVTKLCSNAVNEILNGYIEPSPIYDSNFDIPKSCTYCKLYGFCNLEKAKYSLGRNISNKVDTKSFEKKEGGEDE